MKPYSLRKRLVVVLVAAVTGVLAALAVCLYVVVRDAAWKQFDDGLLSRARALAAIAEHDEDGYEMELPPQPAKEPRTYVEVWDPDGKPLARSRGLVEPPLGAEPTPASVAHGRSAILHEDHISDDELPAFLHTRLPDGRDGRAVAISFLPRDESGDAREMHLLLAEGTQDVERMINTVRTWLLIIGLIALLVMALFVWRIVGVALQPLDRTALLIDRIDDKSLARRLPLDNQPVELVAPVRKLNDLLGRLETSFARERQFTADVSHELRTPLAGLRTLLEVTALSDRSAAEYQQALADSHAIVLQLGALVENLLMLARVDAGQLAITPSDVELRELVDECWKPYAHLAASRGITFKNQLTAGSHSIDREKLRVILANLLSNAAEYTERGGWIEVNADGALVAVVDSGPALPDTTKIFDRLWRGDSARTETGAHCGIGLALAKSLAAQLELSLTAENRDDGSVRFACSRQHSER